MVELLSTKRVQSFRAIQEDEVARLVQAVSSAASTSLVNVSKFLSTYNNDVIVRCVVGDHRLIDRNTLISYITKAIEYAQAPTIADLFPSWRLACALTHKFGKMDLFIDRLFEFMDTIISDNKTQMDEAHQEDITSVLLRIHREGNHQFTLTMGTIKAVVFDLLLSGTHTVTTIIDWAMAELMRNPLVMSRAQSEVRTAFMEEMKVTEEGLRKLRYFHWVIKETLRLHTPGPLLIGRGSQETCRVMGYDVPKGSMVLPETFKPERFENDTRDFRGHDFEFTPFGAGRRMCPGVSFGLASVELALANLLFHFDWNLPDGVDANKLDMAETMGFVGKRKAELWLKPILRVPFASRN
ncbi:hypothetical protein HU200_022017 [Digitaria exilis]|uniref:Cytochrome P450 n=1 Tax=Digitaria exilis TaxID=1010633 RepID=A0A835C5H5_9POAL|nr:hypothetical protein HU200_022017 [Digitaria exilis]